MFIQWDFEENKVIGLPSNVRGTIGDWLPCIMPPARVSSTQELNWMVTEIEDVAHLVGYWEGSVDPEDAPASLDQIKLVHREMETLPVEVLGILLDADERAETRINNTINAFDDIPLEPGLVEVVNGTKIIYWKDANNVSRPLTKEVLVMAFDELLRKRSIRATALFAKLQYFKNTVGQHTISQINSSEYWLS